MRRRGFSVIFNAALAGVALAAFAGDGVFRDALASPPPEAACPAFRLDQGGSMTHVPPPKQPSMLCAHYVLAQMIDAWRYSHGASTNFRTSGFEIAVAYAVYKKKPLHTDAAVKRVADFLRERRPSVCEESFASPGKGVGLADEDYANLLLEYWKNYTRYLEQESEKARLSKRPIDLGEIFGRGSWCEAERLKCEVFPGGGPTTRELAALIRESDPMVYLNALLNVGCEKHRLSLMVPPLREEAFAPGRRHEIAARLNELISSQGATAQPVSVNFCSKVMYRPAYQGYEGDEMEPDCLKHFALVIGQRFDAKTGECQLLLQDSQNGPECDKEYSRRWECLGGKYWIDRRAVLRNTKYIEYFR